MDQAANFEIKRTESELPVDCAPSPEAIRSHTDKILLSRTFRAAQGQRKFLAYIVEEALAGRGNLIKEYIIGIEALGRGESFDPRLDPIVRTQARKLRARLTKYYETEGANDPLRIDFQKGSYVPSFQTAAKPSLTASTEVAVDLSLSPEPSLLPETISPILEVPVSVPMLSDQQPAATVIGRRWKTIAICLAIVIAVGLTAGGVNLLRDGLQEGVLAADSASIAVLPFVNLGDERADEFLSDGLAEELIDSLRQVPGLQVVARTSAFRFKGRSPDFREIAQKLHVRTVLVGSVRRSEDRLRVSVQLNNAMNGYHLWSGSYDRDSADARSLPLEISRAITNALGVASARNGGRNAMSPQPALASPNPGAHENYLKGLYFWNRLNADGLNRAIQYFKQAIAEDPSFARAYAALAGCYVMSPQVATSPPLEVVSKIRAAASKALELDGTLGEAHIDLAVSAEYEFDWATAEAEFKKGLELSPGNVVGHLWYAKYLALVGRKPEVLAERRLAEQLDPVSPYAVQAVAGYYSVTGRYDDAVEQFHGALALDPNFGLAHQGLGIAYVLQGKCDRAIDELQLANKLMDGPRRTALLGYGYAVCGQKAQANRILNGFLSRSRQGSFPALAIAEIYIGLGDKDRAFDWLGKAIDQRDLDVTLQWDSPYEFLRSDPRFSDLLRRMKLT